MNTKKNTKKQKRRLYLFGAFFSIILILLDQLTKYAASAALKANGSFVLLPGVFELRYLENQGAAFGVLAGKRLIFIIVTVVMALLLLYVYGKIPLERHFYALHGICVALFAGAAGNFIDRVCHHYVIDFFYFSLINFPIFNVADIYVTIAVALFIVLFLFYYKETELERLAELIFPWKQKRGVSKP